MKRFLISLFAVVAAACAFAQQKESMVVEQKDGTQVSYDVSNVRRVFFQTDEPTPPGPEPPQPTPTDYVDLGLPSGVQWATCNLGASAPEESGNYYGWGSTVPYRDGEDITWELYFKNIGGAGKSLQDCGAETDPLRDYAGNNSKSISGTQWDAVTAALGAEWCMPSMADIEELYKFCKVEWTSVNGVYGEKFTGDNGKSIFIPASGYRTGTSLEDADSNGVYWSATPYSTYPSLANGWNFNSKGSYSWSGSSRMNGFTIRPICTSPPVPAFVDLGLPSGLKWASCNLGASTPEEYGDYYGWGCTKPYQKDDNVGWETYFKYLGGFGADFGACGTDLDPLKAYVDPNNKSIAGTEWDAASAQLGGKCRMPTKEDFIELMTKDNCTLTWTTTRSGVTGYRVTSKNNGNSIFLPAAGCRSGGSLKNAGSYGYYWSATPRASYSNDAYYLHFRSSYFDWDYSYRGLGQAVRAVSE